MRASFLGSFSETHGFPSAKGHISLCELHQFVSSLQLLNSAAKFSILSIHIYGVETSQNIL